MIARVTCAALAAILLAGCLPETRISWSPDGKLALVRGGDGLYLCDGQGKLSPRVAENVTAMAWLPDSRRFIAVTNQPAATWDAPVPHLSPERRDAATKEAAAFHAEILAWKGDWQRCEFCTPSADVLAALMCLRDRHGKELGSWPGMEKLQHGVYRVGLYDVADGQAKESKRLFESLEPIAEMRVAPGGKALAWTAPPYPALDGEAAFSLFVASLEAPDKPCRVQDRVSIFFDWKADGRSLVYAWTNEPGEKRDVDLSSDPLSLVYRREHMPSFPPRYGGEERFGFLSLARVTDAGGRLLAPNGGGAGHVVLARIFHFDSLPVCCLADGRILFATPERHLPETGESGWAPALFVVTAKEPCKIERVCKGQAMMESQSSGFELMQLSPDQKRVAFPVSQSLKILDLASKTLTEHPVGRISLKTVPVWRSNDELCVMVPVNGESRDEVVLISPTGTRVLSKDWPESVRKEWLDR